VCHLFQMVLLRICFTFCSFVFFLLILDFQSEYWLSRHILQIAYRFCDNDVHTLLLMRSKAFKKRLKSVTIIPRIRFRISSAKHQMWMETILRVQMRLKSVRKCNNIKNRMMKSLKSSLWNIRREWKQFFHPKSGDLARTEVRTWIS
jgi:hypothetical protein